MTRPIFVADIGNSTIDLAEFRSRDLSPSSLAEPVRTQKVSTNNIDFQSLAGWGSSDSDWIIGSVNRPMHLSLLEWLAKRVVQQVSSVRHDDLRIQTAVRRPEVVGIDRLAAATAANVIRDPNRPSIIVDAGTAITIDVVSKQGVFLGGMIAPGTKLCASALSNNTNQLPNIYVTSSVTSSMTSSGGLNRFVPEFIGDDTDSAIQAGIYWMIAAGVDGIIQRLNNELAGPCDIFVTGGSMPQLLPQLSNPDKLQHVPHLVVAGLSQAKR